MGLVQFNAWARRNAKVRRHREVRRKDTRGVHPRVPHADGRHPQPIRVPAYSSYQSLLVEGYKLKVEGLNRKSKIVNRKLSLLPRAKPQI